jgi:hypothetical protein
MCEDRDQLLEYLYDECDAAGRRKVEAHLTGCESCRDELRDWRAVRTDLLAWDVPAQPSVWTPFAPPKLAPWYRQVPAWAMAAAATVMFAIGAAGGLVARTATASLFAEQKPSAAAPALTDQQIRDLVSTQIQTMAATAVQPASLSLSPADRADVLRRAATLVADSEQRLSQAQKTELATRMTAYYTAADHQWNTQSTTVREWVSNLESSTSRRLDRQDQVLQAITDQRRVQQAQAERKEK